MTGFALKIAGFGFLLFTAISALAGDGSDGPNRYEADFSREPKQYRMTKEDKVWAASLLRRLKEKGRVVYFTRTDLALRRDGAQVEGLVYRSVTRPHLYYIAEGDVMLDLPHGSIYSPGVGGFSMDSPKSRNFAVCLNQHPGGVPVVRHSPIGHESVWWFGNKAWKRLEEWQ